MVTYHSDGMRSAFHLKDKRVDSLNNVPVALSIWISILHSLSQRLFLWEYLIRDLCSQFPVILSIIDPMQKEYFFLFDIFQNREMFPCLN